MKLTDQQSRVVSAGVGNLLISAAAGSGKTSVMTERITSRILSGELDLRHILVMTFTNAAASNMRAKIEAKLTEALAGTKDTAMRRRISEQISFLPMAHISTIHSFCLDVIGNFGYDARTDDGEVIIEPGFSTLDPTRVKLLQQEALDEVLTSLYELSHQTFEDIGAFRSEIVPSVRKKDGREIVPFTLLDGTLTREQWFLDFDRMTASLGGDRNDKAVRDLILGFHSYLRSMPGYEDWIKEKLSGMQAAAADFESTGSAQTLLSDFRTALSLAKPNMQALCGILAEVVFVKTEAKNREYRDYYAEQLRVVGEILETDNSGGLTWDGCVDFAAQLPSGRGSSASKADGAKAEFFRLYAPVKEVLYYLTGVCSPASDTESFRTPARYLFARKKQELQDELAYMIPVAARLYEVLLLFDDRYAQKKRAENGIDFSDYEHLALLLLSRPDAKKYYSDTFAEIYIDEYQDNSRIQDAIVSCFQRDNCFAVGDVKQSIYRFRHARPQLFLNRMACYRESSDGTLLELNSNFRSLPGILELVNDIFSQILSAPSGEIDYDDTQKLFAERKADTEADRAPSAELILVDLTAAEEASDAASDEASDTESGAAVPDDADEFSADDRADDTEDLGKTEKEAYAVIAKIRELRETCGTAWGDIAVLTRTNSEVAVFCDQLNRHGIPAAGGGASEFLSNRELLLMESLMQVLDNFCQDIPLAAVMRASFPQTGFTPEEMLEVSLLTRACGKRADYFHEKVLFYRESGTDPLLRKKVQDFCNWIDSLRSCSMYLRVSELIERVYVETGLREQVSSLPDGSSRVLALETFREWANAYENGRNGGLYRFVTYVEDIRSRQESPEEFALAASDSDAVHCMSIHRSKGLEFKIVFVAGMDRGFPSGTKGTRILMSEKLGIGIDYIRPDQGYWYPTHYKLAMETEEKRAGLAEHMRVFYVAMTRAEEKLYLVGCVTHTKDGSIGKSASLMHYARREKEEILPAWLVHKAKSYLDWCLMSLVRNPAVDLGPLSGDEGFDEPVRKDVAAGRTRDIRFSLLPFDKLKNSVNSAVSEEEEGGPAPDEQEGSLTEDHPLSAEDEYLFALQRAGVYPYEKMTEFPAKMTVSELKRHVNDYRLPEDEDGAVPLQISSARPVNLVVQPVESAPKPDRDILTATERGILLHSVFQYIDFASLPENPRKEDIYGAVLNLAAHRMIREKLIPQILPYYGSISAFAASALCRRLTAAEKRKESGPFREIPFSITVPAGGTDVSLVQGMIDCWFIEDGCAVLIDYKSDVIRGTAGDKAGVLQERYGLQLDYYTKAIEAASGLKVKERIIWLIPDGLSFLLEAPEKKTL